MSSSAKTHSFVLFSFAFDVAWSIHSSLRLQICNRKLHVSYPLRWYWNYFLVLLWWAIEFVVAPLSLPLFLFDVSLKALWLPRGGRRCGLVERNEVVQSENLEKLTGKNNTSSNDKKPWRPKVSTAMLREFRTLLWYGFQKVLNIPSHFISSTYSLPSELLSTTVIFPVPDGVYCQDVVFLCSNGQVVHLHTLLLLRCNCYRIRKHWVCRNLRR